ncbi:hypothetical protein [Legionella maioricensis]|uniref:Uncharacterized protein n=1 Tax=Legionella maioricensis TaxID=2896528 RepID=A0A9X2D142_9GAMM|nr:hypothetical protein [Legionella maioricensis]MCL9684392.1 hypothetical protein [Legionella maioricensis]MCL9687573.1 hypothetical protein [Legionella maioricensis]
MGNLTPFQSVLHFFSNSAKEEYRKSLIADQEFLKNLEKKLGQRIINDNYEALSEDIKLIENYLASNKQTLIKDSLIFVLDDLKDIDNKITKINKSSVEEDYSKVDEIQTKDSLTSNDYARFQTPEYRIAEINQGKLPKLGTSRGECYGFTYAMVDPKFSPYKNQAVKIDLTKEVHNYQKSQLDREKDQKTVKRTRLTREYFCPDYQQQAQQILDVAKENKGGELQLTRRSSMIGHACYVSVQDDGGIRYMDPNHGAYLFQSPKDFIDFYVAASKNDKEAGVDFRFYSLSELNYDEKETLAESKTWQGVIRSFLTGSKYNDNNSLSSRVTSGIYTALGAGVGAGAGAAFGAAIGSVFPIIGTAVGAIIGAVLGTLIGGGAGWSLNTFAQRNGHYGILSIPHLIQDNWHSFKENPLSFFSPFPSKANDSVAAATDVSFFSSSSKILSHLSPNSPPQKFVVTEELISAERNKNKEETQLKAATLASSVDESHFNLKSSGADEQQIETSLPDPFCTRPKLPH